LGADDRPIDGKEPGKGIGGDVVVDGVVADGGEQQEKAGEELLVGDGQFPYEGAYGQQLFVLLLSRGQGQRLHIPWLLKWKRTFAFICVKEALVAAESQQRLGELCQVQTKQVCSNMVVDLFPEFVAWE